ncbi:MAG: hypothetical protein IPK75_09445 [Acidobacteria bacterium]|nr:hypothetical protein [Acidobacteriota bacterium]
MTEFNFTSPNDFVTWAAGTDPKRANFVIARHALRVLPMTFSAKSRNDPNGRFAKAYLLQCFHVAICLWRQTQVSRGVARTKFRDAADLLSQAASDVFGKNVGPELLPHSAGGVLYFASKYIAEREFANIDRLFEYTRSAVPSEFSSLALFEEMARDASFLVDQESTQSLAALPLWLDKSRPEAWAYFQEAEHQLRDLEVTMRKYDTAWLFWINWYRDILQAGGKRRSGSIFGSAVDGEIVKQPHDFWVGEPDRVIASLLSITEPDTGSLASYIEHYLEDIDRPATIQEVRDALQADGFTVVVPSVRGRLNELTADGRIQRIDRGVYAHRRWVDPHDRRDSIEQDIAELIPDQSPGLSFEPGPGAKFQIADSGTPSAHDQQEFELSKEALLQALDDLKNSCEGSNAFKFLVQIVDRYRSAIDVSSHSVSIDKVFAQGVRLENAKVRIDRDIRNGDLPDQGIMIGEALDSVIALHGPMVMGTERGRTLVSRSREYHQTEAQVAEYKSQARAFILAIKDAKNLVERESQEILSDAIEDIGSGRHPERSLDVARSANTNLVVAMGKLVTTPLGVAGAAIVSHAVVTSAPGVMAVTELSTLLNAVWSFCLTNADVIRGLAGETGAELSWVSSLLNWMHRNRDRAKG